MNAASGDAGNPASKVDTGLASFVLLAQFLRISADPQQIRHERGRGDDPFNVDDILRATKVLQISAKAKQVPVDKLSQQPLPAIALGSDGRFFIIAKFERQGDDCKVLIQRPDGDGKPEVWNNEQLAENYGGTLILMTTREMLSGGQRRFDVSWFIPALVKYRGALRDVLAASFFMQLVALTAEIKTDRRRIIDYLLSPIAKATAEAGRER